MENFKGVKCKKTAKEGCTDKAMKRGKFDGYLLESPVIIT